MQNRVRRIVSGGHTGADRAALDFAIERGLEYGGFVPAGRWTEDGPLPSKYRGMVETESSDVTVRTELNVVNSDGTLIVGHGRLSGGSPATLGFARRHRRPCLYVDMLEMSIEDAAEKVRIWIEVAQISTLNVAGPRGSKDPKVYDATLSLLRAVFA